MRCHIVKAHLGLRRPYGIGERAAARYHDKLAGGSLDRPQPQTQMLGGGQTAADLDDERMLTRERRWN